MGVGSDSGGLYSWLVSPDPGASYHSGSGGICMGGGLSRDITISADQAMCSGYPSTVSVSPVQGTFVSCPPPTATATPEPTETAPYTPTPDPNATCAPLLNEDGTPRMHLALGGQAATNLWPLGGQPAFTEAFIEWDTFSQGWVSTNTERMFIAYQRELSSYDGDEHGVTAHVYCESGAWRADVITTCALKGGAAAGGTSCGNSWSSIPLASNGGLPAAGPIDYSKGTEEPGMRVRPSSWCQVDPVPTNCYERCISGDYSIAAGETLCDVTPQVLIY